MASMIDWREKAHGGMGMHEAGTPSYLITTLYDVIAAVQDGLGSDDALVTATVMRLLRSGRLTWRGKPRVRLGLSQRAAMEAMPRVAPRTTVETSSSLGQREERTP